MGEESKEKEKVAEMAVEERRVERGREGEGGEGLFAKSFRGP